MYFRTSLLFLVLISFPLASRFSPPPLQSGTYGTPVKIATLKDPAIKESSGLVASRTSPGAYWTHNDSGDGPFIYAFDTGGQSLGTFRVNGATNRDWEDIAAGPGPQPNRSYLYIGDTGDNNSKRSEIVVYRVAEPQLTTADKNSTKTRSRTTEPAEAIRIAYPDGAHDAEALLVHPATGNLYIVTKVVLGNPGIYEATAPLTSGKLITMKHLGELQTPSLLGGAITGGSISPDGRHVALCDYFGGYEMTLPAASRNFDEIWKQKPVSFNLGKRKQGESIAYRLDGNAVLATSEGKSPDLIQVELGRRRSRM
jgi:hypothetical protein